MRLRGWVLGFGLLLAACGSSSNGPGGGGNGSDDGGLGPVEPPTPGGGCEGAKLLPVPADPGARGPWAVGAKTITFNGRTTEIWYPAKPGSEAGKAKVSYDIREHLPKADAAKIPDADNTPQSCDCYRDLPIDDAHGPYPVIVFVHGTASFRTQSASINTHWASRGFVVLSSDHPGIGLQDILSGAFGNSNQTRDTTELLEALASPEGDLAFLAGHIDPKHIGLSGHSAGGGAIAGFGDRAQVLVPLASGGTRAGSALVSTLVMGGSKDGIANPTQTKSGYGSSPKKKRFVVLENAGHLAFSDLCVIGADKGGILKVATDHGVNVPPIVSTLARDGCGDQYLSPEDGFAIIDRATTAVFEETLTCSTTAAAAFESLKGAPHVADVEEDL